jgi:hypothetical protein
MFDILSIKQMRSVSSSEWGFGSSEDLNIGCLRKKWKFQLLGFFEYKVLTIYAEIEGYLLRNILSEIELKGSFKLAKAFDLLLDKETNSWVLTQKLYLRITVILFAKFVIFY